MKRPKNGFSKNERKNNCFSRGKVSRSEMIFFCGQKTDFNVPFLKVKNLWKALIRSQSNLNAHISTNFLFHCLPVIYNLYSTHYQNLTILTFRTKILYYVLLFQNFFCWLRSDPYIRRTELISIHIKFLYFFSFRI